MHGAGEREKERLTYYKELVHIVTKAGMSQDLQLGSWRPRRADDISSTLSLSPEAGEDPCPSSKTE